MTNFQLRRATMTTHFAIRAPLLALLTVLLVPTTRADSTAPPPSLPYEIVAIHPHDATAFTQGLAVLNGELVESRGLFGRSAVTINTIKSGTARRRRDVAASYFAEGLAIGGGRIVQLTWKSGVAFVYDTRLKPLGRLHYTGEGWGLAFDGRRWLMSDGSDRITVRALEDFAEQAEMRVTDHGVPVRELNELEYAQGRLYANVWHSDQVAVIDPASGAVDAWIDFSTLRQGFMKPADWDESESVLNGIAFDPANGHFYVTGKCWPVLFEIALKGR